MNLLNYAILDKLLEMFIAKPDYLKQLNNCTKFICLLSAITVTINGHSISCHSILNNVLNIKDRIFLDSVREEEIEDIHPNLQELKILAPHQLSFFGLFLPIEKWSDLTIFEPQTLNEQLRNAAQKVIKCLKIGQTNLLIKIPKQLFYIRFDELPEFGDSTSSNAEDTEPVKLLRRLVKNGFISITSKEGIAIR